MYEFTGSRARVLPQSIAASILRSRGTQSTRTTQRPLPTGPQTYADARYASQRGYAPASGFDALRANYVQALPTYQAPQVRMLDSNPYAGVTQIQDQNQFLAQAQAAALQQTRFAPGTLPDYKGLYRQLTEDQIGSPGGIQNNLAYQHTINSLLAEQGSPTIAVPLAQGQVAASGLYNPDGTYNWDAHNQARAKGYTVV